MIDNVGLTSLTSFSPRANVIGSTSRQKGVAVISLAVETKLISVVRLFAVAPAISALPSFAKVISVARLKLPNVATSCPPVLSTKVLDSPIKLERLDVVALPL